MKRFFASLAGLSFLLLLGAPDARALTPGCEQALGLTAVGSTYVRQVVQRANDALAAADAAEQVDTLFQLTMPSWASGVLSQAAALVDVSLTLSRHAAQLEQATACLAFDAFVLQCQMQKTLESINASFKRAAPLTVMRKQPLLPFLRDRLAHLLEGGTDASFVDDGWGRRYAFDVPGAVWCCNAAGNACVQQADEGLCTTGAAYHTLSGCVNAGCTAPPAAAAADSEPMCPYHSDYLPSDGSGYGCDASVLTARRAYEPLNAELQAMQTLMTKVQDARATANSLWQLQQEIETLAAGGAPPPNAPPAVAPVSPHRQAVGCFNIAHVCQLEPSKRCQTNADCAGGACEPQPGYCSLNINQGCTLDAECNARSLGSCTLGAPPALMRSTLRSPFSAEENPLLLQERFRRERTEEGASREYSDSLKLPAEFAPSEAAARAERERANPFEQTYRTTVRSLVRVWSRIQGAGEAGIFARSTDGARRVTEGQEELREANMRLATLVTDPDQIRAAVIKYAYYLRRSCLHRPCQKALEHVLNIAATDECFPYASGAFLDDTAADPRWKKCAEKACIPLAGVTLDGAECKCFRDNPGADPTDVPVANAAAADFCVPL